MSPRGLPAPSRSQAEVVPCSDEVAEMERPLGLPFFLLCVGVVAGRPAWAGSVDYAQEIQPILDQRCTACHGPRKQENGLRLDAWSRLLQGGDSGPAVIAGKGAESLLYRAVTGASEDVSPMPPKGKRLTPEQIALIRKWIDEGAKGPVAAAPSRPRDGRRL
jgi:mono/diheme cytochrome c family protein